MKYLDDIIKTEDLILLNSYIIKSYDNYEVINYCFYYACLNQKINVMDFLFISFPDNLEFYYSGDPSLIASSLGNLKTLKWLYNKSNIFPFNYEYILREAKSNNKTNVVKWMKSLKKDKDKQICPLHTTLKCKIL